MTRGVSILLTALFLACSWCWCIGMYLPVLLVGDYGWPGFVVFLVPNCIGAMAVGLVLRTPESALRILETHRLAILVFSAWTVVFHFYFVQMIGDRFAGHEPFPASLATLGGLALLVAGVLLGRMSMRWWRVGSLLTYGLSVGCAVMAHVTTDGHAYAAPPLDGSRDHPDLAMVAPAIVFGFLFCPFLDASFLRVRSGCESAVGRRAFVLSFGLLFPLLVLFTLAYAQAFNGVTGWISFYFPLHMLIQSAFTVGVHAREFPPMGRFSRGEPSPSDEPPADRVWQVTAGMLGLILLVAMATSIFASRIEWRLGYELLISAYALPFPAYVWIVMVRRGMSMRLRVRTWVVSCAIAAPMLGAGVLTDLAYWTVPGVAVLLVSPIAVRRMWGQTGGSGG